MRFRDRKEAGRRLGEELMVYSGRDDVVVLGLPRGGVPVAAEVARRLDAPLDVFVVRKLGVPGQEELAMGAIATGEVRVLNDEVVRALRISEEVIDSVAAEQGRELKRRETVYRDDQPPLEVKGRQVMLVDDGLATGSTMRAAVKAVRQLGPARVIVAVPVAAEEACSRIELLADEMVCLMTPENFQAVGYWYQNFSQVVDEEVRQLLRSRRQGASGESKRG